MSDNAERCPECGAVHGHSPICSREQDVERVRRALVAERDHSEWLQRGKRLWIKRAQEWEGKFRIVVHENNQMRRKRSDDTVRLLQERLAAARQRIADLEAERSQLRERDFRTGWAFGWVAREDSPRDRNRASRQRLDWEGWIAAEETDR